MSTLSVTTLDRAQAAAELGSPGIRRDGYGTELEESYPGVSVRMSADGAHYLVTRDRDRVTIRCYGSDTRGVCAGLTARFDNRLDANNKRVAARIVAEDAARWQVPLAVRDGDDDLLIDDSPTITGRVQ